MKQVSLNEEDIKKIFKNETALTRYSRLGFRIVKQLVYLGILYGIFFYALNYPAFWKRLQYAVAKPAETTLEVEKALIPETPPLVLPDYPPTIEIPKIGLSAPIILNIPIDQTVPHLADGVVQMANTALPGEIGNTVITGHSSDYPWSTGHYKNVFALLDKLVVGDKIVIPYKTQILGYKITEISVVKPTDVSILTKTDTPTLTLITCYPVGTTRSRLIVRAALADGQTTGVQQGEIIADSGLPKPR